MDIVDIVSVTLGLLFIAYLIYKAMGERNDEFRAKIDDEIDRLSK